MGDENTNKIKQLLNTDTPDYSYTFHMTEIKISVYNLLLEKALNSIAKSLEAKDVSNVENILKIIVYASKEIQDKQKDLRMTFDFLCGKHSAERIEINKDESKGLKTEEENKKLREKLSKLQLELSKASKENIVLKNNVMFLEEKCSVLNRDNERITAKILRQAQALVTENNKSRSEINEHKSSQIESASNIVWKTGTFNCQNRSCSLLCSNQITVDNVRNLTREQLNEMIQEIYKSKRSYDNDCIKRDKPLMTMEKYLYKYLSNKFGLKSLTIKYASAIVDGIQKYSKTDVNVKLFGMILRNEVEENTLLVVDKIKEVAKETLVFFNRQKSSFRNLTDLNKILGQKKSVLIEEDIWNAIINTLFLNDQENAAKIKEKIYNFIGKVLHKSMEEVESKHNFDMIREEKDFYDEIKSYQKKISYSDFINLLVDHHIRTRKTYLKNIRYSFYDFDSDNDGVLSKKEFINFLLSISVFNDEHREENVDYLLRKVPHCEKYDSFPFNEVVDLFESEQIVLAEGDKCSILDFLAQS